MGKVIVTAQIMPSSPETNMEKLNEEVKKIINTNRGEYVKAEIRPIAFGLKALIVYFLVEDTGGIMGNIEKKIYSIDNIQGYEVSNVQRAL